jgi:hypothetical protein
VDNFDDRYFATLQEATIWGITTNVMRLLGVEAGGLCVQRTTTSLTTINFLAKDHTP